MELMSQLKVRLINLTSKHFALPLLQLTLASGNPPSCWLVLGADLGLKHDFLFTFAVGPFSPHPVCTVVSYFV